MPGVSRTLHDSLAQGTCQPCPPCQDGAVEEGCALLAWQGWGEGRWLPRGHGEVGGGASHLLAAWVVGSTHCPAQACHIAAEDSDEEADAIQKSW